MLNEDLVSVIIPAYNASAFIERTINSVIAQTHKNLEIIIVNDGSTDDTLEICQRFVLQDLRVSIISFANGGVAVARNRGIAAARGRYLAFIDADDLWHPTKIEKQLSALLRLPTDWAAVYTRHRSIGTNDDALRDGQDSAERGYILGRNLVMRYVSNGSTLLVRREAADAVNGFDLDYAAAGLGGCEDFDFELRLAAKYKFEVIPEWLVGYRVHPSSMSFDRVQIVKALTAVTERCIARNPQFDKALCRYARASSHRAALNLLLKERQIALAWHSLRIVLKEDLIYSVGLFLDLCFVRLPLKLIVKLHTLLIAALFSKHVARAYLDCDPTKPLRKRRSPSDKLRVRRHAVLRRFDDALQSESSERFNAHSSPCDDSEQTKRIALKR